ncbi:hypothetical protein ACFLZ9_00720 [Patescibacteria group bacterium]
MKDKYLKEDQDIIEALKKSSSLSSDSVQKSSFKECQFYRLQIESILRNRKSLEDFSRATTNLTLLLLIVGIIQFIVVIFQFIYDIQSSSDKIFGSIILFIIFGFIIWVIKKIGPFIKLK